MAEKNVILVDEKQDLTEETLKRLEEPLLDPLANERKKKRNRVLLLMGLVSGIILCILWITWVAILALA